MLKKLILSSLFTTGLFFAVKAQNNISVTINNIEEAKGVVEISLYNQAATFPHSKGRFKTANATVNGNSVTYQFTNIPDGDYAIALFHDVNNNGQMDKNIFGIPKEPYGFSNNIVHKMSAPNFKECMFSLKGSTNLTISLIN